MTGHGNRPPVDCVPVVNEPETLPEKLARLIRENPGMPIRPLVELCAGEHPYYYGGLEKVEIKTLFKKEFGDEHIYSEEDREYVYDLIIDDIEGTVEERTYEADQLYAELERERVIVITIGMFSDGSTKEEEG